MWAPAQTHLLFVDYVQINCVQYLPLRIAHHHLTKLTIHNELGVKITNHID